MQHGPRVSRRLLLGAAAATGAAGATARAQAPRANGLRVERLAWAGVKLTADGVDLFVDASASSTEDGASGPALVSSAGRCFALATHHHGDHLDIGALQDLLGERGYLVVHDDVARYFDRRALNVQTVRTFEPVFLSRAGGEFVAWCVPASDGLGSPQVSWVIDGGGRRVIHCGDTAWHGGFWDIARAFGPFDIAFLPINGARQVVGRFVDAGQPMMMNPEQAASAAAVLGVRLAVPIHYGQNSDSYFEEDGAERRFVAAARQRRVATRVLRPGEVMSL